MAISIKNKETILCLLNLGQRIQKNYAKIGDEIDSKALLSLLDQESYLLQNFDFSHTSLSEVEELFENQLSIDLKTNIPYCLGPLLTDNTYPYVRLIARLRYEYRKKSKKFENFIIPFEQDIEVAMFYRSLLCDCDLYLEYRDDMQRAARNALIESPLVERAIVQNGMEPLEQVFDCLPFQLDLWTAYQTRRVCGEVQQPANDNLVELKHRRTDILFKENDAMAKRYLDLYKSGQNAQLANFLICVCYFKAIVSLQEPSKRKAIFDVFKMLNARIFEDDHFYDFVEYSKLDIQELLAPTVIKVNFVYRPLKK